MHDFIDSDIRIDCFRGVYASVIRRLFINNLAQSSCPRDTLIASHFHSLRGIPRAGNYVNYRVTLG